MHLQKIHEGRSFSLFPKLLRLFYVGMILDVCSKDFIPPCEGGCIIPNEVHVVEIVVPRTRIEGDEVQRVDGNVVATERKATQLLVRHMDGHTLDSSSTPLHPNHSFLTRLQKRAGQGVVQTPQLQFLGG